MQVGNLEARNKGIQDEQQWNETAGYDMIANHELEHSKDQPGRSPREDKMWSTMASHTGAKRDAERAQGSLNKYLSDIKVPKSLPNPDYSYLIEERGKTQLRLDRALQEQQAAAKKWDDGGMQADRQAIEDSSSKNEVGPSVGDLVFRSEQFAREEGKPLQHQVQLPGGKTHDINWMRQQAKQHGYWDGRPMDDLIFNTPEGRQWYQQMADGEARMDKGGMCGMNKQAFDLIIEQAAEKLATDKVAMDKEAVGAVAARLAKAVMSGRAAAGAATASRSQTVQLAKQIANTRSMQGIAVAKPENLRQVFTRSATAQSLRDGLKASPPIKIREGIEAATKSVHNEDKWQALLDRVRNSGPKVSGPMHARFDQIVSGRSSRLGMHNRLENVRGQIYTPSAWERIRGLILPKSTIPSSTGIEAFATTRLSPHVKNPEKIIDAWSKRTQVTLPQWQRVKDMVKSQAKAIAPAAIRRQNLFTKIYDRRSAARGYGNGNAEFLPENIRTSLSRQLVEATGKGDNLYKAFSPQVMNNLPPGSPLWHSGIPTVAVDYLKRYKNMGMASKPNSTLLSVTTPQQLATHGTLGPATRHVSVNTRNMSPAEAKKLRYFHTNVHPDRLALQSNYERVGTLSDFDNWIRSNRIFQPNIATGQLRELSPRAFGHRFQQPQPQLTTAGSR